MKYDAKGLQVRIMRQATRFEKRDILEIGCGDGEISMDLAQNARSYTGIDPDRERIAEALSRINPLKHNHIGFKPGSGQNLKFEDLTFDLILFTLSLHHQNSVRALDEAYRVLKPGGHVLVVEPCVDSHFQQFFHLFDDETLALKVACDAVANSKFNKLTQSHFEVTAEFENKTELCQYHFNRTHKANDDEERILSLLTALYGETGEKPFQIKDKLNLFLIEKPFD
ncbi:MAG: class I SAM-dependent methyltransferase [Desulfobacterales bacterium]|nr:class I SAM-dependent methyltransferase [Desulfobacterales bacterium]